MPSSNAEQLRAMVNLLSPDEMTPVAKRQLERLADQWDEADLVPVAQHNIWTVKTLVMAGMTWDQARIVFDESMDQGRQVAVPREVRERINSWHR
jgi:hypothetical protein